VEWAVKLAFSPFFDRGNPLALGKLNRSIQNEGDVWARQGRDNGETMLEIGEIIKERRSQLGLSQEDLAKRAGVAKRTIQSAESKSAKARQSLRPKTLKAIATALNLESDALIEGPAVDAEDAFGDDLLTLHGFVRRKILPSESSYCHSRFEAEAAIGLMRDSWRSHLLRSGRQLSEWSFAVADRILNERFLTYQSRYLDIWQKNPGTIRFAVDGNRKTGVSVVLPVTDEAYDLLWRGEIDYLQITAEDILPNSQNIVIDSAVEFAENPKLSWFQITERLSYAVFSQLATLSVDPRADDFRMVSFGASDANIKRLRSNGFRVNGNQMPTFDFPLLEFAANNFDLTDDQYERTSTVAHVLHLLQRRLGANTATRVKRQVVSHALGALRSVSTPNGNNKQTVN
jgi:transcriptional regulator with XRE-family HTH domain